LAVLSPAEWTAIWLSLKIAVTATIASLSAGIFVSYALPSAKPVLRIRDKIEPLAAYRLAIKGAV
jgi:ABC-type molybdate transport system permease subunit